MAICPFRVWGKDMNLIEMLERNAVNHPDKLALVYKDVELSYRELNEQATRLAGGMLNLGVKKGDRVALMLHRTPQLITAFLASVKIGAIAVPLNYNLTKDQLAKILSFLKPSIIFTNIKFSRVLHDAILINDFTVVVADSISSPNIFWDDLLKGSAAPCVADITQDDIAYLNYTSGSTGEQKGAMATYANIYWNTLSAIEVFQITERDVHLCMFASFAHPHELFARALYTGGTMVLLDEISPKSLARTIKEHGVTCMMGLAPMYEMLLDVAKGQDLVSLRIAESGGMYTRKELMERFEKKFGIPIYTVWGSTETTGIAIANRIGDKMKNGSIGKCCPYYEAKVVDETGRGVNIGEIGELIFKGPAIVKGYYGMGDETSKCFRNGWYYSNDLGRVDEEGFFYFVDRKSAMMKVAGLKVYPSEIEQVLAIHPKIKEVAVVASPDGLKGEIPRAVIVTKDKHTITREEIHQFCKGRLPNYKAPRIIEFRQELPKMSSGKIDKKTIAEENAFKAQGENKQ